MSYDKLIEKLELSSLAVLAIFVTAIILPGIGFFFVEYRPLFESLSTAKLILLSAAIGFPLTLICALTSSDNPEDLKGVHELEIYIAITSLTGMLQFYVMLFFKHIFDWSMKTFIVIFIVSEIGTFFYNKIKSKYKKKVAIATPEASIDNGIKKDIPNEKLSPIPDPNPNS